MADNTWIALAAAQASDPTAWSLGVPVAGQRLKWGAGSSNNCSWDLDALTVTADGWVMEVGYGGTISQGAVDIGIGATGYEQNAGVLNANISKDIIDAGNFLQYGGTINGYKVRLKTTGTGKTVSTITTNDFERVWNTGQIAWESTKLNVARIQNDASAIISISANKQLCWDKWAAPYTYANNGEINGDGLLLLAINVVDATINLGIVNCNVEVATHTAARNNRKLTLLANATLGKNLLVRSEHPTYTITLHHGTNYQLEVDGLTTLGARGIMTQGTGQWSLDGGYVQNGASSVFNQGGNINANGISVTAGSYVGHDSYQIYNSGNLYVTTGWSSYKGNVRMLTDGTTISGNTFEVNACYIKANVALSVPTLYIDVTTSIDLGKTLTIANGSTYNHTSVSPAFWLNSGNVAGEGTLKWYHNSGNQTMVPGNITCKFYLLGGSTNNCSVTLGEDMAPSSITIRSEHATYTASLILNGHTITSTAIDIKIRGILTGSGIINASVVVESGGSLAMTDGIIRAPSFDSSAGSLSLGTTVYEQDGSGTVKLGAGQSFYDVEAPVEPLDLASNITITRNYVHARTEVLNGFDLILTDPNKEVWLFRPKEILAGQWNDTTQLMGQYDGTN